MKLNLYQNKVWVFNKAVDFRKSITGLVQIVSEHDEVELKQGIFVFYNKQATKVKIILWHKNGFIMLYKCIANGKFLFEADESNTVKINEDEFSWLLAGLPWQKMSTWGELDYNKFS